MGPLSQVSLKEGSSITVENIKMVLYLIVEKGQTISWNENVIRKMWDKEVADKILIIPLRGKDVRCWASEKAGTCSMKAIYNN